MIYTFPEADVNARDMGASERRTTKKSHLKDLIKNITDMDNAGVNATMTIPWSFKYPEFLNDGKRLGRVLAEEFVIPVISVIIKQQQVRAT